MFVSSKLSDCGALRLQLPSQFELPPGRENAVLYVNELRTVQRGGRTRFAQIAIVALVAVGLLCWYEASPSNVVPSAAFSIERRSV